MKKKLTFLDLFAGCGGLSEGFIQAGFIPVAHVEMDAAACFSLRTRMAYHWLTANGKENIYSDYLKGDTSRTELYSCIPSDITDMVIHEEINEISLNGIFDKIDKRLTGKIDIIIGGPPCQAYSLVGRARNNGMFGDKRNYLFLFYAEFLKRYQPEFFVFENVSGLLSAKDTAGCRYFDMMMETFDKAGYYAEYRLISADKYGVPQKRKRIILIGARKGKVFHYPELKSSALEATVNELINDLPKLHAGEGKYHSYRLSAAHDYLYKIGVADKKFPVTFHVSRPNNSQDLEIYRIAVNKWNKEKTQLNYNDLPERLKTHRNTSSFTDRFKVVSGDLKASHTVVAHISKDGHYYIHPDINQNRSLTPREAARLQTFPDNYFFEAVTEKPSLATAFRQIGNAVPVYLAKQIAEKLKEELANV